MTNFIIYKTEAVQPDEFAAFWASKFDSNGYPEEPYANSIGNLTRDAIEALFEWKNGMRLSTRKARSIDNNFIARIGEAKALGAKASPKEFLQKFAMGGAIWRIFWLHCCRPEFPMYDQHVHRAMTFIEEGQRDELGKKSDHRKIEIYLTRYLSFYKEQFVRIEPRRVDKALWAFGKFLKTSGLPEPSGTAQA